MQNINIIEGNLRSLSVEARKTHPAVQEAADRAIMKLRTLTAIDEVASVELLRPFLLACSHRKAPPKLSITALTGLQRLLSCQVVDLKQLLNITRVLIIQADSGKEDIQVKVLQTLPLVMTPDAFDLDHDITAQALKICCSLYDVKSTVISRTTEATLRQIIFLLFDHLEESLQEASSSPRDNKKFGVDGTLSKPDSVNITGRPRSNSDTSISTLSKADKILSMENLATQAPAFKAAYLLLQDLCILGGGSAAVWLRDSTLNPILTLELIESIISKYVNLFRAQGDFTRIIKSQLCSSIVSWITKVSDFPNLVRMMRIIRSIICVYGDILIAESNSLCNLLVSYIYREDKAGPDVDVSISEWRRSMAVEVLLEWTKQPDLLRSLGAFGIDNKTPSIFCNVVEALCIAAKSGFESNPTSHYNFNRAALTLSKRPSRDLEMLNVEVEPRLPSEEVLVLVMVESIIHSVEALSWNSDGKVKKLWKTPSMGSMSSNSSGEVMHSMKRVESSVIRVEMIKECWRLILVSLSAGLNTCTEERFVQNILRAYQSFVGTAGSLNMHDVRSGFLSSLCQLALPSNEKGLLSLSNVQILKTILNIAHCFGEFLGSSWVMLLKTLQNMDTIIVTRSQVSSSMGEVGFDEINILTDACDKLFESSIILSDTALMEVIQALSFLIEDAAQVLVKETSSTETSVGEETPQKSVKERLRAVALERLGVLIKEFPSPSVLESPIAPTNSAPPVLVATVDKKSLPCSFALVRLILTAKFNISRLDLFWSEIRGRLIDCVNSPSTIVQDFALESVNSLFMEAMNYKDHNIEDGNAIVDTEITTLVDESFEDDEDEVYTPVSLIGEENNNKSLSLVTKIASKSRKRPSDMQVELLEILECFLTASPPLQNSEVVFSTLLGILNNTGHIITTGWSIILRVLTNAVNLIRDNEAYITQLAFKSVQLIIDDFLEIIPLNHMKDLITCIRAYGNQADINIALTSVGMLLKIADFAGNDNLDIKMAMLTELSSLSFDERPGVRNCAVQTLYQAIGTHAQDFTVLSWQNCINEFVLQVLIKMKKVANEACKKESKIMEDSSGNKGKQQLMLHHTRDTMEKQWNETKILAMQGSTRVIRQVIMDLHMNNWFETAWFSLIKFFEEDALSNGFEVSCSAILCLQDLAQLVISQTPLIRETKYGSKMRVVDGALTNVNEDGEAIGLKSSRVSSAIIAPSANESPRLIDSEVRLRYWEAVWSCLELVCQSNYVIVTEGGDLLKKVIKCLKYLLQCGRDEGGEFKKPQVISRLILVIKSMMVQTSEQPDAISAASRGRLNQSLIELNNLLGEIMPISKEAWITLYNVVFNFFIRGPSIPFANAMLAQLENLFKGNIEDEDQFILLKCEHLHIIFSSLFEIIMKGVYNYNSDGNLISSSVVPSKGNLIKSFATILFNSLPVLSKSKLPNKEFVLNEILIKQIRIMISIDVTENITYSLDVDFVILNALIESTVNVYKFNNTLPISTFEKIVQLLSDGCSKDMALKNHSLASKCMELMFTLSGCAYSESDIELKKILSLLGSNLLRRTTDILNNYLFIYKEGVRIHQDSEIQETKIAIKNISLVPFELLNISQVSAIEKNSKSIEKGDSSTKPFAQLSSLIHMLIDCCIVEDEEIRILMIDQCKQLLNRVGIKSSTL